MLVFFMFWAIEDAGEELLAGDAMRLLSQELAASVRRDINGDFAFSASLASASRQRLGLTSFYFSPR